MDLDFDILGEYKFSIAKLYFDISGDAKLFAGTGQAGDCMEAGSQKF